MTIQSEDVAVPTRGDTDTTVATMPNDRGRHRNGRRRSPRSFWSPARTSLATIDQPPPPPDGPDGDDHGGGGRRNEPVRVTMNLTQKAFDRLVWLGEQNGDDNTTVVNRTVLQMAWAQEELGSEDRFEKAIELYQAIVDALTRGDQIFIAATGAVMALASDGSIRPLQARLT